MSCKICVVGAGVIGLSSAVRVQEEFPDCHITLVADKFSPNTTSDGAGGLFEVFQAGSDTPLAEIREWALCTLEHLNKLYFSPEASNARVQHISGYLLASKKPLFSDVGYHFRDLSEDEKRLFPKSNWSQFFTSYQVDCTSYLPWLMKRFLSRGGRVLVKRITSLQEIYSEYDIIINCTGLGSSKLLSDTKLVPARGETIRVKAPWIKHFYAKDDDDSITYIIPGSKNVVLGGTYQLGNWDENGNSKDRQEIWKRCLELQPSLENAEIDYHWVGLRPTRSSVRLEMEKVPTTNCWVIHNYGHGGSGVTLHWGCAGEVVQLVKQALHQISTRYTSKL